MSFPRYPEYKDSGLPWFGEVPEHWEIRRLKFLLIEIDKRAEDQELELLGLSKSLGIVKRSELEQGASESDNYSKYKVVDENQLVMNKMQAWNGVFGLSPIQGMVSPDYSVFEFTVARYEKFLTALFKTDMMAGAFFTRCRGMGTAFLRLNTSDFLDVKIAFPPIDDVQHISSFLFSQTSKIDALVAEQEKLIELLKEKRIAVISHAVTKGLNPNAKMKDSGIEWLGEIPEHWEVIPLKFLVTMKSGEQITAEDIDEVGVYPVFGGNGIRGYTSSFTHEGYFPLIGRQGALCGNINYGIGKFWASEHAVVVSSSSQCNTLWLGETLRTMNLGQYSITVAQPGLSVEVIGNLRLQIPPIEEQNAIATYLANVTAQIDGLIETAQLGIELLKERRSALISAAITGKIDVRNLSNAKEAA